MKMLYIAACAARVLPHQRVHRWLWLPNCSQFCNMLMSQESHQCASHSTNLRAPGVLRAPQCGCDILGLQGCLLCPAGRARHCSSFAMWSEDCAQCVMHPWQKGPMSCLQCLAAQHSPVGAAPPQLCKKACERSAWHSCRDVWHGRLAYSWPGKPYRHQQCSAMEDQVSTRDVPPRPCRRAVEEPGWAVTSAAGWTFSWLGPPCSSPRPWASLLLALCPCCPCPRCSPPGD